MFNINEILVMAEDDLLGGGGEAAPETAAPETAPQETPEKEEPAVDNPETESKEESPEWMSSIDEEFRKDMLMKGFKDVNDLAKSYIHAKKFVGADKVAIPSKHATEEEWKAVYKKLGLPDTLDKYEIKTSPDGGFTEDLMGKFKEIAHSNGILPHQAQKIVEFYENNIKETTKQMDEEYKTELANTKKTLTEEWGDAYQAKISKAQYAAKELGGAEFIDHLKTKNMANDLKVLQFLAKVGETITSEDFSGTREPGQGSLTPEDAMKKLDTIRGDATHPYNIADHPAHNAALKEAEKLARYAYGEFE